jgi:hypothetical protein
MPSGPDYSNGEEPAKRKSFLNFNLQIRILDPGRTAKTCKRAFCVPAV